jgi:iron complex outermembrane receptor protein
LGLNYTYGRGFFEQYKEDQKFSTYGSTPIELDGEVVDRTDLIRRRWLDNDFYVINANARYKNKQIEINSGAFFSTYKGDHYGEVIWARFADNSEIRDRYYFSDATKDEFTVFSKATYRINGQWQVFADLQGRFISYKTGGITSDIVAIDVNENFAFFNPKAGVSFQIDPANQLYAYYGKAHREPARNDFEDGITIPEKLDDFELGWRYASEKLKVNSNIFYMDYKDQLVLSGELNDVGAALRTTSGSSYRLGIEIDAELQLSEKWKLMPNIALSSNKNRHFVASIDGELRKLGTSNISFSPKIVASNMLLFLPTPNLQIGFLSKYVGEQYMGNIDSEASILDSFFVNDLNIYYELSNIPVFKAIVFSGLVNNIFDVKYVSNGYFFTYDDDFSIPGTITTIEGAGYYPQAGINFLVGVTLKF